MLTVHGWVVWVWPSWRRGDIGGVSGTCLNVDVMFDAIYLVCVSSCCRGAHLCSRTLVAQHPLTIAAVLVLG